MEQIKTDIEIAQAAHMLPVTEIAEKAGIDEKYLEQYGKYKAKIDYGILKDMADKENGKLILVTAISPTPAGEGKTTTSVGLADALSRIGKNVMVALREPSLGPVFGIKGGAAGGGYAQLVPMEDINLHFTGDMHAIGAANNLIAAMLDEKAFDREMEDEVNLVADKAKELAEMLGRKVTPLELAGEGDVTSEQIADAIRLTGGRIEDLEQTT